MNLTFIAYMYMYLLIVKRELFAQHHAQNIHLSLSQGSQQKVISCH